MGRHLDRQRERATSSRWGRSTSLLGKALCLAIVSTLAFSAVACSSSDGDGGTTTTVGANEQSSEDASSSTNEDHGEATPSTSPTETTFSPRDIELAGEVAVCVAVGGCPGANLVGAIVSGEILDGADLSGVELRVSVISGMSFVGANLSGADLSTSDIYDSDFTNADLTGANLSFTKIEDSTFAGASVDGVNWDEATVCRTTMSDGTVRTDVDCAPPIE